MILVIECSIILHGLLFYPDQVALKAAIKTFMLIFFKPPLQYSWQKTVFLILLVPFQIKLKIVHIGLLALFRLG